jgi:hypothetical protein
VWPTTAHAQCLLRHSRIDCPFCLAATISSAAAEDRYIAAATPRSTRASRDAQGREFFDPGGIRRGGEFQSAAIAKPAGTTFVHGMLAGRTQSDIPAAVFLSAIANGKADVACGSIDPEVQIMACTARCGPG